MIKYCHKADELKAALTVLITDGNVGHHRGVRINMLADRLGTLNSFRVLVCPFVLFGGLYEKSWHYNGKRQRPSRN